jgi:hypothetical protein
LFRVAGIEEVSVRADDNPLLRVEFASDPYLHSLLMRVITRRLDMPPYPSRPTAGLGLRYPVTAAVTVEVAMLGLACSWWAEKA